MLRRHRPTGIYLSICRRRVQPRLAQPKPRRDHQPILPNLSSWLLPQQADKQTDKQTDRHARTHAHTRRLPVPASRQTDRAGILSCLERDPAGRQGIYAAIAVGRRSLRAGKRLGSRRRVGGTTLVQISDPSAVPGPGGKEQKMDPAYLPTCLPHLPASAAQSQSPEMPKSQNSEMPKCRPGEGAAACTAG